MSRGSSSSPRAVLRREELLNGTVFVAPDAHLSTSQVQALRVSRRAIFSVRIRRHMESVPTLWPLPASGAFLGLALFAAPAVPLRGATSLGTPRSRTCQQVRDRLSSLSTRTSSKPCESCDPLRAARRPRLPHRSSLLAVVRNRSSQHPACEANLRRLSSERAAWPIVRKKSDSSLKARRHRSPRRRRITISAPRECMTIPATVSSIGIAGSTGRPLCT